MSKTIYLFLALTFIISFSLYGALSKQFMLIPVQGVVEYSEDGKNWNQLIKRVVLKKGQVYIYTHEDAYGQIVFSDMSEIKVAPQTKLKLDGTSVFVYQGNNWFKVEKQLSGELIIETPTSIAGIRGTEFEVNVDETGTSSSIMVYKGAVEVKDRLKKEKVLLRQGKKLFLNIRNKLLHRQLISFKPAERLKKFWSKSKWQKMKFNFLRKGPTKILPKSKLGKVKFPKLQELGKKLGFSIQKNGFKQVKKVTNNLKNKLNLTGTKPAEAIKSSGKIVKTGIKEKIKNYFKVPEGKDSKKLLRPQDKLKRFNDKNLIPRRPSLIQEILKNYKQGNIPPVRQNIPAKVPSLPGVPRQNNGIINTYPIKKLPYPLPVPPNIRPLNNIPAGSPSLPPEKQQLLDKEIRYIEKLGIKRIN